MKTKKQRKFILNEDWTATAIGGLIILLFIAAYALFRIEPRWPAFRWENANDLVDKVFALDNLEHTMIVFVFSFLCIFLANLFQGNGLKSMSGYPVLFILTFIAMTIGGATLMKDWGLETVIFSLLIGLFINNVFGVPEWVRRALCSELYIKIGLVLLGANVIFGDILKAGSLGLIQSVIVVLGVWYFSFWLCKKMKIDKEMAMMLSSAVSICGVSAAVATAGAIRGDKKKLSYVVSLVLVVAIPMIILMPALARLLGLDETMSGAWIGGTIDTTGAVVATGAMYGEKALEIGSIVKFSQNVLLGVAAFLIAIYWSYTNNKGNEYAEKPSFKVIWSRFPKFVLGFLLASLLFSFVLSPADNKPMMETLKKLQGLWFALGFTSIGMETNFKTLVNVENRRATLTFLGAQTFNVVFTLIVAYLVFGIKW
jgi:uncharacterized integral membrane protein (TIGR00698 family)